MFEFLQKIKKKVKKCKEYEGDVFMFFLTEGDNFKNIKYRHFSDAAITGSIRLGPSVTFLLEVVGFYDAGAPERNWGMGLKEFRKRYSYKKYNDPPKDQKNYKKWWEKIFGKRENLAELRKATQRGDMEALMKRISNAKPR